MIFYKHYIGDYQRDTGQLDLAQHGAYRLMLDEFYATATPLPADRRALYRLLRAENGAEKRAIDAVASRFWRPIPADFSELFALLNLNKDDEKHALGIVASEWTAPDGLINVRALSEIVKSAIVCDKNRRIAIVREEKKRLKAMEENQGNGGAQ